MSCRVCCLFCVGAHWPTLIKPNLTTIIVFLNFSLACLNFRCSNQSKLILCCVLFNIYQFFLNLIYRKSNTFQVLKSAVYLDNI
jgi:hypothetical protein